MISAFAFAKCDYTLNSIVRWHIVKIDQLGFPPLGIAGEWGVRMALGNEVNQ